MQTTVDSDPRWYDAALAAAPMFTKARRASDVPTVPADVLAWMHRQKILTKSRGRFKLTEIGRTLVRFREDQPPEGSEDIWDRWDRVSVGWSDVEEDVIGGDVCVGPGNTWVRRKPGAE